MKSGRWPGYQTAHAIEMDCPAWLLAAQVKYPDDLASYEICVLEGLREQFGPVAESDSLELQMSDLDGVTR